MGMMARRGVVRWRSFLLSGVSALALGLGGALTVLPTLAQAGNTDIPGGAPGDGDTVSVKGGDSLTWDAADGTGSSTADIEFTGGGGAASIKLEDSGTGGWLTFRTIDVSDDQGTSTVNIDATNGDIEVFLQGNVTNSDATPVNDVKIVLIDGGNTASFTVDGYADPQSAYTVDGCTYPQGCQTIEATIDGAADGEGVLTLQGNVPAVFTRNIGATGRLKSIVIGDTAEPSAGIGTFEGTVEADTITVYGVGSEATFRKGVTTTGEFKADLSTVTVGAASTFGALTIDEATADFTGLVTVNGDVLVQQQGDATFNDGLDVNGDMSVITTGKTTVESTADISGSLEIDNATISFSGPLTMSGGAAEKVFVDNGAVATFSGEVDASNGASLQVGSASDGPATVTFSDATHFGGAADIDGTATFNARSAGQLFQAGATTVGAHHATTLNVNSGMKLASLTVGAKDATIVIGKTATFDPVAAAQVIEVTGGTTVNGALSIKLGDGTGAIADGSTITVIKDSGTNFGAIVVVGTPTAGQIGLIDSAMIDLQDASSTGRLDVQVVYDTTPEGATGNALAALGQALKAASEGNDDEAWDALVNLAASETQAAGETLLPGNTGAGNPQVVAAATKGAMGTVGARLALGRVSRGQWFQQASLGAQETGMSAGSEGMTAGVWMQGFGNLSSQDTSGSDPGYDATTGGLTIGADTRLGPEDRWTAGGAFSFAGTNVDGRETTNAQTDMNTYQFMAYGGYTAPQWYVDAMVAYGLQSVDTARTIAIGALRRTARGEYQNHQLSTNLAVGVPVGVGENFVITPEASLFYLHNWAQSYTETGAGALNLKVDPDDLDVLEGAIGATVAYRHETAEYTWYPEMRAALLYEFLGERGNTTSTYTGGGSAFKTQGADPAQIGGTVGVGLNVASADGTYEFGLDYDAELRAGFVSHTGMLKFRYNF